SGGVPNVLLSFGKPQEVRDFCKRVIDEVAPDGGYIMDAGAIMQDDTSIENLRALTETTREYGVYGGTTAPLQATPPSAVPASVADRARLQGLKGCGQPSRVPAGQCFPWDEKARDLPPVTGDTAMVQRVWEQIDGLGNMFIWQLLLSF
ncbi:MAG TPA: uroporphyrinogen decarboxylase family protein, partial [Candidatus Sulfotelmatobacter sp.]|nr:uroporphyrinogen decarboxylase family protein [Candidatus Sulfotelmatobacter sp.]